MADEEKDRVAEKVDGSGEAGAGPEPGSLEEELSRLRDALAQKESEAKEHYDRYLRERAELENFKKRTLRHQAEQRKFLAEDIFRDLLPIVDNLERAVEHASRGGDGAPLVEGVALVLKSLHELLTRHGVTAVEAKPGDPFDPERHEAVAREETEGEPNRVVVLYEKGYMLHDRLLRPAKVAVSCPKTRGDRPGGEEAVEKKPGGD
ncbi:MAG: protein GrpE [Candidatus Binatia bacterium]|nr:MAG: protein GrpE [Candidatus Binatia bacterium]